MCFFFFFATVSFIYFFVLRVALLLYRNLSAAMALCCLRDQRTPLLHCLSLCVYKSLLCVTRRRRKKERKKELISSFRGIVIDAAKWGVVFFKRFLFFLNININISSGWRVSSITLWRPTFVSCISPKKKIKIKKS
jgi:hypothetical protein